MDDRCDMAGEFYDDWNEWKIPKNMSFLGVESMFICTNCGAKVIHKSLICPHCNAIMRGESNAN